jgi:ABC-type hemin transport system substrate-binding protein
MTEGNGRSAILTFTSAPRRVVSLVPSMTESLFDLGAGGALVGVTDYCRPPADAAEGLARVGGTKSTDVQAVLRLKPDLVIANQEENRRQVVEALEAAGVKVWVTYPRTVDEAIRILWALVDLFRLPHAAPRVKTLEMTLEWTARAMAEKAGQRTFCPIWRGQTEDGRSWWMTFRRDTYAHDVLARCGAANVFADRERRYPLAADLGQAEAEDPGERDTHYPRVTDEEVLRAEPQVVLLPSEPFAFGEPHLQLVEETFASTPAVRDGRVHLVDGSLITWHGTRLARALGELPSYFAA